MSSGETGSFRKEGPTEQVSFKFFSPKFSIALWAGRTAQIVRSFFAHDMRGAGYWSCSSNVLCPVDECPERLASHGVKSFWP